MNKEVTKKELQKNIVKRGSFAIFYRELGLNLPKLIYEEHG